MTGGIFNNPAKSIKTNNRDITFNLLVTETNTTPAITLKIYQ